MSQDDPFAEPDDDAEKTVIRPSPGGRRPAASAAAPPPQRGAPMPTGPQVAITQTGINPLVAAASALLGLAIRLKNRASHSDVEGLHGRVVNEVKKFERAALNSGASPEAVRATVAVSSWEAPGSSMSCGAGCFLSAVSSSWMPIFSTSSRVSTSSESWEMRWGSVRVGTSPVSSARAGLR